MGAKHGKPSRLGVLVNQRFSSIWSCMDKSVREKQYIYPKSLTYPLQRKKIGLKKLNKIEVNTICKAITVHGQFQGSSIGLRLSQTALNSIILTQLQRDVIIGILLGDGHIKTVGIKGQPMIQFNQGFVHLSYVLFVYNYLAPLCTHYPSLIRQRDGLFYLQIYTRCLLCLTPIYENFVVNGCKIIP